MSLTSSLDALCDLLQQRTGLVTRLGAPGDATDGLFVWPYRLSPAATVSGAAPSRAVRLTTRRQLVDVPVLVFAPGAANAAHIEGAMSTLLANPVLTSGDDAVRVTMDSRLSMSDLSRLFIAARVPQMLALEIVLHIPISLAVRGAEPPLETPPA